MAAAMCFTTACTDLTPEVYTDVTSDNYFTTPEQFSNLIANAYAQMIGEYGYVYREGYWSMQEYTTDEVVIPTHGTDWYDNGVPIAMHQHTWTFNTRDINNGWSFAYGGTANVIPYFVTSVKSRVQMNHSMMKQLGLVLLRLKPSVRSTTSSH